MISFLIWSRTGHLLGSARIIYPRQASSARERGHLHRSDHLELRSFERTSLAEEDFEDLTRFRFHFTLKPFNNWAILLKKYSYDIFFDLVKNWSSFRFCPHYLPSSGLLSKGCPRYLHRSDLLELRSFERTSPRWGGLKGVEIVQYPKEDQTVQLSPILMIQLDPKWRKNMKKQKVSGRLFFSTVSLWKIHFWN